MNANSLMLEKAGFDESTDVQGVLKDSNEKPTGELMAIAVQYMIQKITGNPFFDAIDSSVLYQFAASARNAGFTTAADLVESLDEKGVAVFQEATS